MSRIITLLFALVLVACEACGGSIPIPDHARPADLASVTIALVVPDGRPYCSGVWVGRDEILTAAHCALADTEPLLYRTEPESPVYSARIKRLDVDHDLALLQATGLAESHGTAVVGEDPHAGDPVQAMGHPIGLWDTWTRGDVSAVRHDDDGFWWIQATPPVGPGSSGGGLFDARGNLIGITRGSYTRVQNANVFVHTKHIRDILRSE